VADARLNELDHGVFEGGPFWDYGTWLSGHGIHARPPGAAESQLEGLTRMAAVLRDVLARPDRALVIGHGLLVSVLAQVRAGGSATARVFPEAGYLAPLAFTDADLAALHQDLPTMNADDDGQPPDHGRPQESEKSVRVVTVESDRRRETMPP
jgi:probable phosphoglycerate mutase